MTTRYHNNDNLTERQRKLNARLDRELACRAGGKLGSGRRRPRGSRCPTARACEAADPHEVYSPYLQLNAALHQNRAFRMFVPRLHAGSRLPAAPTDHG